MDRAQERNVVEDQGPSQRRHSNSRSLGRKRQRNAGQEGKANNQRRAFPAVTDRPTRPISISGDRRWGQLWKDDGREWWGGWESASTLA